MYRNLDAELKRKDITRGELARKMKLTPSTMSLKLNGKSEISLKEAMQIKSIIGVDIPIEELFRETVSGSAV